MTTAAQAPDTGEAPAPNGSIDDRPRAARPDDEGLVDFLREAGLAAEDEEGDWTPLSGGVSSDIWRVDLVRGPVCVKRALAQLKVKADWAAPVERNAVEWAYMEAASKIALGSVPSPLAHDPARGLFVMSWLEPARFPLWKEQLLAGVISLPLAAAVGGLIGRIHAATADDAAIAARFATDASFDALRIEPYLRFTAGKHPDLAEVLESIAQLTESTRRVLVHGDVSPKNILHGPNGPVLLDAECGWFGDPAFDVAFCLTHLTIKAGVLHQARGSLVAAFDAFVSAYRKEVVWESWEDLESRAAALLAALALARVDGKSPVEYLDEQQRGALRGRARAVLLAQPRDLAGTRDRLLS